MKIALAQLNTTVGDLPGNEQKIWEAYQRGVNDRVDLVMVPELAVTGYPPRDLLLKRSFIEHNQEVVERLAKRTGRTGLLVGYVGGTSQRPGLTTSNAVALLQNGRVLATQAKTLLPTYDVFDEDRYFIPATGNRPVAFNGRLIGLTVCEDVWNDEDFWEERRYHSNPAAELAGEGAELILNTSASPWHLGKNELRREMLGRLAAKIQRPLIYCNAVGGNDELIFDGGSLVINGEGKVLAQGAKFDDDYLVVDMSAPPDEIRLENEPIEARLYGALVLGVHDYLYKCGFRSAVIGLSGGVDSALTACLAVAALGAENVWGVSLPSQFSSSHSLEDAKRVAAHLGIRYDTIPIQGSFKAVQESLRPMFAGMDEDVTEENIQARLRGIMLMALSNKFGALLLSTGNKSELAVGYCTLYGDMAGGLAVLSDVPKTMVYRLARWINREREVIPQNTIDKAPSAELRPDQTDQDSLPSYDLLDQIMEEYVVAGRTAGEMIESGMDEATVRQVVRLIDRNEYKRRQAAPGLKVTSKAFGMGRRMPIAQRYQE